MILFAQCSFARFAHKAKINFLKKSAVARKKINNTHNLKKQLFFQSPTLEKFAHTTRFIQWTRYFVKKKDVYLLFSESLASGCASWNTEYEQIFPKNFFFKFKSDNVNFLAKQLFFKFFSKFNFGKICSYYSVHPASALLCREKGCSSTFSCIFS